MATKEPKQLNPVSARRFLLWMLGINIAIVALLGLGVGAVLGNQALTVRAIIDLRKQITTLRTTANENVERLEAIKRATQAPYILPK